MQQSPPTIGARIAGIVGLVLYLGVGYFYLFSGLLVPLPGAAVLWVVWIAGLVVVVRWQRGHPGRVLAAPFVAAAFWLAYVWFGDTYLGWTA